MGSTDDRRAMIKSLQNRVVPWLRGIGFTGSFPHLRRLTSLQTDLVTFQFDRYGGGFVVEFAKAPPRDLVTMEGKRIPRKRLTVFDLDPSRRHRLGARPRGDRWFRYDMGPPQLPDPSTFDELADQVRDLLETEAVVWWREDDFPT